MFVGYPERGTSILEYDPVEMLAVDGLPYSTLSYANGPGPNTHHLNGSRVNITDDNFNSVTYRVRSPVRLGSETHGGDDVHNSKDK